MQVLGIYIYIWRENKDGNKQWEPLLIYIEEVKMGMGIGVESWNQDKATERGIPARVLVTTYKAFHIFKTLTWFIWNTLSICNEIGRKYYFRIWDIMVILINSKTKKVVRERERVASVRSHGSKPLCEHHISASLAAHGSCWLAVILKFLVLLLKENDVL